MYYCLSIILYSKFCTTWDLFKNLSPFQSSEEKIIYSTVLVYSPEPSDDGLLRLDGATIPVECHYDK